MTIPLITATAIFLALIFAAAEALGSPATLAVIPSSETVCGVLAGSGGGRIRCARFGQPTISIAANSSFEAVSGGRDFFCGLSSGGKRIFCWTIKSFSAGLVSTKRIYNGPAPLVDLSVGEDQVCAVEKNGTRVLCWRGDGSFPAIVEGEFRSLTSGRGFSCGIGIGNRVECWGGRGTEFQNAFVGVSMTSIVAGDSHVCGIDVAGFLICRGSNSSGQLNVPSGEAFEFSGLAAGANHSCAIKQANNSVICWGEDVGEKSLGFVLIVAGGDLTCGITTDNFTVICWKSNDKNHSFFALHLPQILPGICVEAESFCKCGVFPDSESLCSYSGVICSSCGPPFISPPPPPAESSQSFSKTSKAWLFFAIVGSFCGIAATCSSIICCVRRRTRRNKKVHNSIKPPPAFSSLRERAEEFAFDELSSITNNFSLECRIGIGSFGAVYRGRLKNNREVAIKRGDFKTSQQNLKHHEKERAFQSELMFLSRLHHKHLVDLVGYCDQREEKLLIYEFMQNGSLYDHLHTNIRTGLIDCWNMRIKILLDAARGIEYLHNYAVPPVIHRDIKSSNILLDGEWVAKVSDFGLSMGPEEEGDCVAAAAAGTMGYIDPEYYGGVRQLTTKSDVYGFGVVMLEMLTGKRAIFGEGRSVVEYAVGRIDEGEVGMVLDGRMRRPEMREAEAVGLVARAAANCVRMDGKERMSIADVVVKLESARALALCDDVKSCCSSSKLSFDSVGID